MNIIYVTDNGCFLKGEEHYLSIGLYTIVERYSYAFGKITLFSRCRVCDTLPVGCRKADFINNYIDVFDLKTVLLKDDRKLDLKIKKSDLIICRLPSFTGYKAFNYANKHHILYMSEVMGDPWEQYWNHGFLGKMVAPYMFFKLKQILKKSDYAVYVTKSFLQNRYPCTCHCISASNVSLPETNENILEKCENKLDRFDSRNFSLLTTAAVDVAYKGQRYVIEAISILKKRGINVTYYLAGAGKQENLKKYAEKFKVKDNLVFLGGLQHSEIFDVLDRTDIYIQPSLQEGLPRALIEALSRGCICFGARTAGIPELLEKQFIFKRKSAKAIAVCLENLDQIDLKKTAKRNFDYSKNFTNKVLDIRRNQYFQEIKKDILKCEEKDEDR